MLASNELSRHSPGPLLDSKALCATVRMWVNRTQSDPMFAAIRLPMTVRFVTDMKPAEDQMERSMSLSRSTTSFESVMTVPAEFRSNRSPVIVRPVTLETLMATLLLINALSEADTFSIETSVESTTINCPMSEPLTTRPDSSLKYRIGLPFTRLSTDIE